MVETEVIVAVAALVISLVALLVTTQQLLVQIFASADGYRQCAASVIGIWHKRRKRVWKWSEFRFETQYVTPQIIILTAWEFKDFREKGEQVWRIDDPDLSKSKELDHTVHELYSRVRTLKGRRTKDPSLEIEKGRPQSELPISRQHAKLSSDTQVTWLRFLHELHLLSCNYWPGECNSCFDLPGARTASRGRMSRLEYLSSPWVRRGSLSSLAASPLMLIETCGNSYRVHSLAAPRSKHITYLYHYHLPDMDMGIHATRSYSASR